jgi:hypothetical protein
VNLEAHRLIAKKFALAARLGDLEIHVAIAINLLAEGNVDLRKWGVMLLIVPILPVQLVAFDLVRGCRLNGVIAESNQVELRLVAFISRLRLSLRRWRLILGLRLGLLLGWRRSLSLPLRRVALLITVIRLRGRRRGIAAVSIGIVSVCIGTVRVPISWVAIVIRVAAESKIETRSVVGPIGAVVVISAAMVNAAGMVNAHRPAVETTTDPACMTGGKSSASGSAPGMSPATMLPVSRSY